jgi:hypothetical protein
MQMEYSELEGFRESTRELYLKGGPFKNAADRVTSVWGKAHQGMAFEAVFQGLALTHSGESRLPHCRKYELPGRARLVVAVNDNRCMFLFAGDHESVDRWADRNRGVDFIARQRSGQNVIEHTPGVERVTGSGTNFASAEHLLESLGSRYRDRLLNGLSSELVTLLDSINPIHTDDELQEIVLRVQPAEQQAAILDTLLKLRDDDVTGAKNRVDLYTYSQATSSRADAPGTIDSESLPLWLTIHTRTALRAFIFTLARSHKWSTVYIISPWISTFDVEAGMSFDQMLKRMRDDDATAYVVTRPPRVEDKWHTAAIALLAESKQASVKLVDDLHTKLYCAQTAQRDFAMLGSANMTQASLENRELAMLVRASGAGRPLVQRLREEAASIYRTPGKQYCKRQLGGR